MLLFLPKPKPPVTPLSSPTHMSPTAQASSVATPSQVATSHAISNGQGSSSPSPSLLLTSRPRAPHEPSPPKRARLDDPARPHPPSQHPQQQQQQQQQATQPPQSQAAQTKQQKLSPRDECIRKYVFPHVFKATIVYPRDRYDVPAMGANVIQTLTDARFVDEFHRGNGILSHEFQQEIALRARREVAALSNDPQYRLPRPSNVAPVAGRPNPTANWSVSSSPVPGLQAPTVSTPRIETPVPVPRAAASPASRVTTPVSAPTQGLGPRPVPHKVTPVPVPHVTGAPRPPVISPPPKRVIAAPPPRPTNVPIPPRPTNVPIPPRPTNVPIPPRPAVEPAVPRPLSQTPIPLPSTTAYVLPPKTSAGAKSADGVASQRTMLPVSKIDSYIQNLGTPTSRPIIAPPPKRNEVIVIDDSEDEAEAAKKQPASLTTKAPVTVANNTSAPAISQTSLPIVTHNFSTPDPNAPRQKKHRRAQTPLVAPLKPPVPTSPENFRTRAHALVWKGSGGDGADEKPSGSRWFSGQHRPYLAFDSRAWLLSGAHKFVRLGNNVLSQPSTLHVDFEAQEIRDLRALIRKVLQSPPSKKKDAQRDIRKLVKKNPNFIPAILRAVEEQGVPRHRTSTDVENFLKDIQLHHTRTDPAVLTLERDDLDRQGEFLHSSRVHSLLLAREVLGTCGFGRMRKLVNFENEFRKCREDRLELKSEWTDCAGDISTIAWVSNDSFVCGTTEHSDAHNQQYNRPGNLALGSCSLGSLRAYPHHRIVRPVVDKGENATDAMRQSQDPWLYTSVVASDYDAAHDRAFTAGFDRAVKIWKVDKTGASMDLLGEWKHAGNVNFVVSSRHESGMVATAADVASEAVRIYKVDEAAISSSPYRSFSCSRVTDSEGNPISTETWAYFPATMQWGIEESVRHLLLVGYSPRSVTLDETDIPEDRRNSGELCLWDGLSGERWRLTSLTSSNVFEVIWHPSQPCFVAATSPAGMDILGSPVRTQIRIFRPSNNIEYDGKAFGPVKTLDCTAVDINELTIMPNSFSYCYVTAGCTDGNVYVWDTALGDKPIHVLRHGPPMETIHGDREKEDVGVKFTAWGDTPDRFYSGSSDGVVKVWNIRSLEKPLVRDLLEVSGPVSCGMFSPDKSKLLIGDGSGRLFLLSVEDEAQQKEASFLHVQIPGSNRTRSIRRPRSIIPHPEPDPPPCDGNYQPIEKETGLSRGRAYLEKEQLVRHPNPTIGVVQGPKYLETKLFRREAHLDHDPAQPLLAQFEVLQREASMSGPLGTRRRHRALKEVTELNQDAADALHRKNKAVDLDPGELDLETRLGLQAEGVDWEAEPDWAFELEEDPPDIEGSVSESESESESGDDNEDEDMEMQME